MNSLDFNYKGVLASSFGIKGCPKTPLLSSRKANTIAIPGRDGVYDFGNEGYDPLILLIDCMVIAVNRSARDIALAAAATWLTGNGTLSLGHNFNKQFASAKVYGQIDLDLAGRSGQFQLSFQCNPPFIQDVNATAGTIGTAQDYGSPVEFYPVITITKSGTSAASLQVALTSTGEFVKVTDTIAAGDILVFDMGLNKVTKNGTACMSKVSIDSLFFGVPSGTQTITITTTSTYTATMSYKKRYFYD